MQHIVTALSVGGMPRLRGQVVSQETWDQIVQSAAFESGVPAMYIAFAGSEINASIKLSHKNFTHQLDFSGATVTRFIELEDCEFSRYLLARNTYFHKSALVCRGSKFYDEVDISYSSVESTSHNFNECTFARGLKGDGTTGAIYLAGATVNGPFSFACSQASLIAQNTTLRGGIEIAYSEFQVFLGEGLIAETANRFGPCSGNAIQLKRATFKARVALDVSTAGSVDLSGATLEQGGALYVRQGTIDLSQVRLGGPLRVSGKDSLPEVTSILNADASQMTFSKVDMRRCLFYGAHGIDELSLEASVILPVAPWWAGRRRCIPDEFAWRATASAWRKWGWKLDGVQVGSEPPKVRKGEPNPVHFQFMGASEVAGTYRELRRTLESKSDMSGAAVFYYGEMEMRRFSNGIPFLERLLVCLYWATSGYGLRPMRALVWWLAVVGAGAFAMSFGVCGAERWELRRGLLFALRASLPGVSTLETLAPFGQGIEIGLRIAGPLLIALFVLAIRARVMRKPGE